MGARILPRALEISPTCTVLFIVAYLEAGEGLPDRNRRLLRVCGQLTTLWRGPVILAGD